MNISDVQSYLVWIGKNITDVPLSVDGSFLLVAAQAKTLDSSVPLPFTSYSIFSPPGTLDRPSDYTQNQPSSPPSWLHTALSHHYPLFRYLQTPPEEAVRGEHKRPRAPRVRFETHSSFALRSCLLPPPPANHWCSRDVRADLLLGDRNSSDSGLWLKDSPMALPNLPQTAQQSRMIAPSLLSCSPPLGSDLHCGLMALPQLPQFSLTLSFLPIKSLHV